MDTAAPPLTASLHNTPDFHDGRNLFTIELRFSEGVSLSSTALKNHAFTTVGGRVVDAQRIKKSNKIAWRITIKPVSAGDVTITLPATENCRTQGAICTKDGRELSNQLRLTVSGPGW